MMKEVNDLVGHKKIGWVHCVPKNLREGSQKNFKMNLINAH